MNIDTLTALITANTDILFSFFIYSFLGWIIESSYRTVREKRGFINSGFLHNPFIPMYGFGAVIIILLEKLLASVLFPLRILIFTIICTVFEYLTGLFFEKLFRIRLWDYSNHKFNLHGRICLSLSLIWALLVTVFILFIKPAVDSLVLVRLSVTPKFYIILTLAVVIIADTIISILELKKTAGLINSMIGMASELKDIIQDMVMKKVKNRFLKIFPNLEIIFNNRLKSYFMTEIHEKSRNSNLTKALGIIFSSPKKPDDLDPGYLETVNDLLAHETVQKMSEFRHHDDTTLHHSLVVSQTSYFLARAFKFDEKSAARGALLHDLFLYDWRDGTEKHHATRHPHIALQNARKHFRINPVEEDIIVKHMWPLTGRFFRYRESFLVSMVDKIVSVKDAGNMGLNMIRKKQTKQDR